VPIPILCSLTSGREFYVRLDLVPWANLWGSGYHGGLTNLEIRDPIGSVESSRSGSQRSPFARRSGSQIAPVVARSPLAWYRVSISGLRPPNATERFSSLESGRADHPLQRRG